MASLQDITLIVIAYAKQTSRFTTPTNIMDPIVPSPQSLGPDVFSDFYFELLNALISRRHKPCESPCAL